MNSNLYKIVDRRTGERYGYAVYLSRERAEDKITEWQNRHDKGGRPDITRDMLLNMEPRRLDD